MNHYILWGEKKVMGWGRTIPHNDVAGQHLDRLNGLINDRLAGRKAHLDIWQLTIETFEGGYIERATKKDEKGNSNAIRENKLVRKMSNYASLGLQGRVGAGFERNRHTSR